VRGRKCSARHKAPPRPSLRDGWQAWSAWVRGEPAQSRRHLPATDRIQRAASCALSCSRTLPLGPDAILSGCKDAIGIERVLHLLVQLGQRPAAPVISLGNQIHVVEVGAILAVTVLLGVCDKL